MRKSALFAVLLAFASGPIGHAAAPKDDPCKRAKQVLGASEVTRDMTPEQCLAAMDTAEEERWQLWLDIAAADEVAGDNERAALSLSRFVDAADQRERPLPPQWVVARDQARATVARLDVELLKTKGRVTIRSIPPGAEATIVGGGAVTVPDKGPKTPLTGYFVPGEHTVRVRALDTDASREVSFTVVVGGTIALEIDLRPGSPGGKGVAETQGPPVLSQRTDLGVPPEQPLEQQPPTTETEREGPPTDEDNDPEGPPVHEPKPHLGRSLGTAALTAGGAALAIGVTFALIGSGLDDEAACSGSACDVEPELREHVRRDADVAWNRATGTFIIGGLLVAGGVVALILDGGGDENPAPITGITPWLGPDGAGLSGRVSF